MKVCAVILAGGKGTRSADPRVPKIAQNVGGKSLLAWHLDLIRSTSINDLLVVTGHLADQVEDLVDASDTSEITVQCFREIDPRGTVGALQLVMESTDFDVYLVILGDILISMPIDSFIENFQLSGKGVGVVVHPSLHPKDSDAVFEEWNSRVTVVPKGGDRSGIPNMSSAGLFAVLSGTLERYRGVRDLGSDLLYRASLESDLYVQVSSHYLKDAGTPDRLDQVNQDIESGNFSRRGSLTSRPAILLDRDGVINESNPEVYRAKDYFVLEGVAESIRQVNTAGIPVFVVTNQPGIAKGLMSFEEHQKIRAELDRQLASSRAFVDEYFFCPHHPEVGFSGEVVELKVECNCRKPKSGMLVEIEKGHDIDLTRSVVIGDTSRDHGLARGVDAEFIHVSAACNVVEKHECVTNTVSAIEMARKRLSC